MNFKYMPLRNLVASVSLALLLSLAGGALRAQPLPPKLIPAPGGEVILPTPGDVRAYDASHYAAARRAGDYIYVSGVIISRPSGAPNDVAMFKAQTRSAFERLGARLRASGVNFADVVMINSFHVWDSPDFAADRSAHFAAFSEVKDEFMSAPHPAWTAVGTTGLLGERGIVEVQMIAYSPQRR